MSGWGDSIFVNIPVFPELISEFNVIPITRGLRGQGGFESGYSIFLGKQRHEKNKDSFGKENEGSWINKWYVGGCLQGCGTE